MQTESSDSSTLQSSYIINYWNLITFLCFDDFICSAAFIIGLNHKFAYIHIGANSTDNIILFTKDKL